MDQAKMIAARNAMAQWQSPIGTKPFGMANSVHPEDRAGTILSEASAILHALDAGSLDAQALSDKGETSEFQAISPRDLAAALGGVGSLIDFANFLLEDAA